MLGAGGSLDPLLKRPFSFLGTNGEGIQILYRVVGKGTSLMRSLKRGDRVEVVGPLGNPYPNPGGKSTPLIIAGGVGVASLMPLIERHGKKAIVLYGARTRGELLLLDEIEALCGDLRASTEDGSYGKKGVVTTLLDKIAADSSQKRHILYACGPKGMLRAVSKAALDRGLKGYVSLEERMACGVGACLGCAVKTKKGYLRVCKEGPVFGIDEVIWQDYP